MSDFMRIQFDSFEEEDIRKAAELNGESVEEFIFEAVVERAEKVLARFAEKAGPTDA